jgi:hypothetical protein
MPKINPPNVIKKSTHGEKNNPPNVTLAGSKKGETETANALIQQNSVRNMEDSVYNDFLNNYRNPVYLRERAILGAANTCVKLLILPPAPCPTGHYPP